MFGLIELVVTGLICSLSLAVVAIVIQTLQIRKRKGSRERESLLSSAAATRRLRGKIRIQKATKVPTKHLRSQSIGLTESPQKPSYKHPQQHYRRKSSPNISNKIKNSNSSSTLISISPNLKCDKLFSLHQVQPTASPTGVDPYADGNGKVGKTGGKNAVNAKTKHLYLPEPKEHQHPAEKFTSPFKTSEKEMEAMFGLENLNNNHHHAYAYDEGLYIVAEK